MTCGDIFLGLLAILFPPIAVWIKRGICSVDGLINILLFVLGYIPGLIHAWYIISKYPDEEAAYGYEIIPEDSLERGQGGGQRITYYYVSHEALPPNGGAAPAHPSPATGAPDAGRAQREQARQGNTSPMPPQVYRDDPAEGAADGATPPTYAEAVKGDHKVQTT